MSEQNNAKKVINLFDYTEEQLLQNHELTHYDILNLSEYATPDDVKKAYRKASLKYHPDKTGRGDDDYVFLAVKAAYDTLMDHAKRQAYDSTVIPFDDAIPPARSSLFAESSMLLYTDDDFYDTFGPVFQRNLRFDARLRPDLATKKASFTKSTGKGSSSHKPKAPPTLGTDDTPIEQVNEFYDYWVRFESWRDFSAQAADELQVENELENAESRFEKRWIQKEIDKRAKQLKKQEMQRIHTLVERAMEADPRLRRERQAAAERKEKARQERLAAEERKKEEQKRLQELELEREEQERQRKAEEKIQREKDKKQFRKAKQELRRMASSTFEEHSDEGIWPDSYDMNQDIDFLCSSLTLVEIKDLTESVKEESGPAVLHVIKGHVEKIKETGKEEDKDQRGTENQGRNGISHEKSQENPESNGSIPSKQLPWTKDELSALAKAVKKFPPGGASRWDQITMFVNNLCKQEVPRSKEECIEKFNAIAKSGKPTDKTAAATTHGAAAAKSDASATPSEQPVSQPQLAQGEGGVEDSWTPEQDQQLQDGLAKYPATMEKNERWSKIAECVSGKSKKDCVQRFKSIREALKSRK